MFPACWTLGSRSLDARITKYGDLEQRGGDGFHHAQVDWLWAWRNARGWVAVNQSRGAHGTANGTVL
jgi:hypothetical protein